MEKSQSGKLQPSTGMKEQALASSGTNQQSHNDRGNISQHKPRSKLPTLKSKRLPRKENKTAHPSAADQYVDVLSHSHVPKPMSPGINRKTSEKETVNTFGKAKDYKKKTATKASQSNPNKHPTKIPLPFPTWEWEVQPKTREANQNRNGTALFSDLPGKILCKWPSKACLPSEDNKPYKYSPSISHIPKPTKNHEQNKNCSGNSNELKVNCQHTTADMATDCSEEPCPYGDYSQGSVDYNTITGPGSDDSLVGNVTQQSQSLQSFGHAGEYDGNGCSGLQGSQLPQTQDQLKVGSAGMGKLFPEEQNSKKKMESQRDYDKDEVIEKRYWGDPPEHNNQEVPWGTAIEPEEFFYIAAPKASNPVEVKTTEASGALNNMGSKVDQEFLGIPWKTLSTEDNLGGESVLPIIDQSQPAHDTRVDEKGDIGENNSQPTKYQDLSQANIKIAGPACTVDIGYSEDDSTVLTPVSKVKQTTGISAADVKPAGRHCEGASARQAMPSSDDSGTDQTSLDSIKQSRLANPHMKQVRYSGHNEWYSDVEASDLTTQISAAETNSSESIEEQFTAPPPLSHRQRRKSSNTERGSVEAFERDARNITRQVAQLRQEVRVDIQQTTNDLKQWQQAVERADRTAKAMKALREDTYNLGTDFQQIKEKMSAMNKDTASLQAALKEQAETNKYINKLIEYSRKHYRRLSAS